MMHNKQNLDAIGNSLNQFGFRKNAIAVREDSRIVYAGNGIVQYCIQNKILVCPVVWIPESMTETEAKAFALADNQSARLSEWDEEMMLETLDEISDTFAANVLGFDEKEITSKLEELANVDIAVSEMGVTPAKPKSENNSGLVKLLFSPSELGTVEKALRLAKKASRGEAMTEICKYFLDNNSEAESE